MLDVIWDFHLYLLRWWDFDIIYFLRWWDQTTPSLYYILVALAMWYCKFVFFCYLLFKIISPSYVMWEIFVISSSMIYAIWIKIPKAMCYSNTFYGPQSGMYGIASSDERKATPTNVILQAFSCGQPITVMEPCCISHPAFEPGGCGRRRRSGGSSRVWQRENKAKQRLHGNM